MAHHIRILSQKDVHGALSMHEAIDVVSDAFAQLSNGTLRMPTRMVTDFDGTTLLYKPAASKKEAIIGVKVLTQAGANKGGELPVIQGIIILTDYTDGRFLAFLDGNYITALRTGAASGLATRWLSKEDARVAAIFGAGVQARTQLAGICAVREIEKVYIFDTNHKAADNFISEMQSQCAAKLVIGQTIKVLRDVDVICTATDSRTPLFGFSDLKKGAHINAMGSFKPSMNEIAAEVVAHALVYVDHKESAWSESGDLINPLQLGLIDKSHIVGEIGSLISRKIPGRVDDEQITLFKSVGVAVQDLVTAYTVYRKAISTNIGQIINM